MINSTSLQISSQAETHVPSNPHKNSLVPSRLHQVSFDFRNKRLINTSFLIKTTFTSCSPLKATTRCYTPSPDETLYDLLGISESVTLSEIKLAYRQMALKYHPDVCPPDCAHECNMRFIQVKEAYKTLSNPESRAMYDTCITKGLKHLGQTSSDEKRQRKATWETQVEELKQRSAMDDDGRTSWAARVRKQRRENGSDSNQHGSDPDQYGSC